MKKNTVKKIFLFFLIYLPLQYAGVGLIGMKYGEPWPAFVLPAFQNVDASPQYIAVKEPELSVQSSANERLKVAPQVLFSGIQQSQLQGFMRTHFGNRKQWLLKGEQANRWLYDQISANYPAVREPKTLEVRWVKKYYDLSSSRATIDSIAVLNKFVINLRDE